MKEVYCDCSKTGFNTAKIHLTGPCEWSNFAHQLFQALKNLRWLPRVFTNNPSYLAYDTKGNLVTLSLRFGSRNSPLSLPM